VVRSWLLVVALTALVWAQAAFEISFVRVTANKVVAGEPVEILVTMTGPAPRAGQLPVVSSRPDVCQAYPAPFNAGESLIRVVVPTRSVEKDTQVTLSIGVYGNMRDIQVTVEPEAAAVTQLLMPPRMISGDRGVVTVVLDRPGRRPTRLTLVGNENVTIGSLTIPANVRQFEAPFATKVLRQGGKATLTYRGARPVVGETQLLPPVEVASVQFESAQVEGGQTLQGTVTLTGPAAAPARVKLSAPANLRIPPEVTVAEGSASARFTVVAATAHKAQNCTVEAATPIGRKTTVLLVNPSASQAVTEAVQYFLMASSKEGWTTVTDREGKKWRLRDIGNQKLALQPFGYTVSLQGLSEEQHTVYVRLTVTGSQEDWKVTEVQVLPAPWSVP
jgi:hypothetical protein